MKLVLSCDHGGNFIPPDYEHLFMLDHDVLNSHRAYGIGTADLYTYLEPLAEFSAINKVSRLLIDPTRNVRSPDLFSKNVRELSQEERLIIIDRHYKPYRNKVIAGIENCIASKKLVFHLAVHSFPPILNGEVRQADIGLLFDPKKSLEKAICIKLKANINRLAPELRVRFNYPHAGISDGFTTFLRKQYADEYAAIELEVNQKFAPQNVMSQHIKNVLTIALSNALNPQ